MKTVLIALNSKFIHAALASWYLKAVCGGKYGRMKVMEYTINDSMDAVLASIYREKADVAAFSCYIWNITQVLKIIEDIKKLQPQMKIILGGPEVSYDAASMLNSHHSIDFIISGEGEVPFQQLMKCFFSGCREYGSVPGLTWRNGGEVVSNQACSYLEPLDSIPSPYSEEMLDALGNRIVYFESSRGCPFSCSYCISSISEGVRYFSMERVREDLARLIRTGVKQIKFVDRTFNSHRERAKEIFRFILGLAETEAKLPNFHFEAAADLFDDEMLEILSTAPAGLIQFEIGVQSTNPETLVLIQRKTALEHVFDRVERLYRMGNLHLHLDLIAGLPVEDFSSFKRSFDQVYGLRPHQLQLGFLKMLKGSRIREEAAVHHYLFRSQPPYEILNNKYISFDELLEIRDVEEMVERYYNSGRFVKTLKYLIQHFFSSPFEFYYGFSKFNRERGYLGRPLSNRELYTVLLEYAEELNAVEEPQGKVWNDLLKLDFLSSDNTNNLPSGLKRELVAGFKDLCFDFLKEANHIRRYLPHMEGMPSKQIIKHVHFEIFDYKYFEENDNIYFKPGRSVVLFDYTSRNKTTGGYAHSIIEMDV